MMVNLIGPDATDTAGDFLAEVSESEHDFGFINRYWNDPAFKAVCDAETTAMRVKANAAIDAGMAGLSARQVARWGCEL